MYHNQNTLVLKVGEVQLSIDNLMALSKLYNLSTDYILGLEKGKKDKTIKIWEDIIDNKGV